MGRKIARIRKNIMPVLRELLIVFVGVFAAFWMNDCRNEQIEKEKTEKLYHVIYDDLDRFYESGKIENKNGFINFFSDLHRERDSLLKKGELPTQSFISGDYWNLDIIHSLFDSGRLADIEPAIYQRLSLLRKNHENFSSFIQQNNDYYMHYVTPNSDKGTSEFFDEEGKLKEKYYMVRGTSASINGYPELLVEWAYDIKEEIKEKYNVADKALD